MSKTLYLHLLLLGSLSLGISQESTLYLRDSIYIDRGISGTTDFEPETRILFVEYDGEGRILEQLHERLGGDGSWRPQSRRMFAYEGGNLVEMHVQLWSVNNEIWLDQRRDRYRYEQDLRVEFVRQLAPQGQLENERRWTYSYNEDGQKTGVLLQQWDGADWQNLSRKVVTYNENLDIESQTLQLWFNGSWRNVRTREWAYEATGPRFRVRVTTTRIWSTEINDWVDQLRKIFLYNDDGQWVGSRFEAWQEGTETWVNTDRMLYSYNGQGRPNGQLLQRWDGDWENRGQVSFAYKDDQFQSEIATWNEAFGEWNPFLRYEVVLNDQQRVSSRVGMQAWNETEMMWENREFTQRYTYYWSENIINSLSTIEALHSCTVPNPYPSGHFFFCDLPPNRRPYRLELFDLLGRPVYQMDFQSGQALSIDRRPTPGMYVLRIHDGERAYHLQRLVIH